jgi:hypothetical protein
MASQWFVRGGGKVYGPLDDARLRRLVADGKIDGRTDIATAATGPWHPAARVRGLFAPKNTNSPKVPEPHCDTQATQLKSQPEPKGAASPYRENENTGPEPPAGPIIRNPHDNAASLPPSIAPQKPLSISGSRKCPTCGNPCAINARACLQCGYRFPNNTPFIIGGVLIAVVIIGGIAASVIRKQQEDAEIWREVHRQSRERQETLQREISDGYRRLGDHIMGR